VRYIKNKTESKPSPQEIINTDIPASLDEIKSQLDILYHSCILASPFHMGGMSVCVHTLSVIFHGQKTLGNNNSEQIFTLFFLSLVILYFGMFLYVFQ
jgi:hypothetical protein